jgi:hypothetical protein
MPPPAPVTTTTLPAAMFVAMSRDCTGTLLNTI